MTTATKASAKARSRRMARTPSNNSDNNKDTASKKPSAGIAQATAQASDAPKKTTKIDLVLGLLSRAEGATLDQMVVATGWLPHTTRAARTGLKKKDHFVTSEKLDGVRTYRVATSSKA